MRAVLLLLMIILPAEMLFAQKDSVAYSREYQFKEGIYLSYLQFVKNDPIPKDAITNTNRGINAPDFYVQLFGKNTVTYKDNNGAEQKIELKDIWGYCQDQSIFIGTRNASRVPVIGSLCHFTRVEMEEGPMMNGVAGPIYTPPHQEINQYILDTRTGAVRSFTVADFTELLQKYDDVLYKEFSALKKRKKKDMKFLYLRKFNEKHPLYLPVTE
jgi:hypothetical protein